MTTAISMADILSAKIERRHAVVGIVGLGVVGFSQAAGLTRAGFRTVGIDIDEDRVVSLENGQNGAVSPNGDLASLPSAQLFRVTGNFDDLAETDCVIVCVPTSYRPDGAPDLTALQDAAAAVARRLRTGMLVIIESTVPPGTTRQRLLPILQSSGLRAGENFFLAFSPERIDPGNTTYPVEAIAKVVGGMTPACTEVATALYKHLTGEVYPVASPEVAEMAKVFENTFRYVNVGLVNELALLCGAMNLDVQEVIDACSTKPFAFMAHRPGTGVGGRCIPMAPRFLAWAASEVGGKLPITDAAIRVNDVMPHRVVQRVRTLLCGQSASRDRPSVLLLGLAYKPNLADTRGSVALCVAAELLRDGMRVLYHDPHVPSTRIDGQQLYSQNLEPGLLASVDGVVVLCPHEAIDYELVLRHGKVVLDPTCRLAPDGGRVFRI